MAMKVRIQTMVAAGFAAALTVSGSAAWAQGEGHGNAPVAPVLPVPKDATPTVKPAAVLDTAWQQALWTVFDGMHRLQRRERLAASRTLAAEPLDAEEVHSARVISLPPQRFTWLPAGGLRDAVEQSPWEFTPVTIEPATESPVDTRGEHGILLGARLHLPWILP
jgi:hypothetical protein